MEDGDPGPHPAAAQPVEVAQLAAEPDHLLPGGRRLDRAVGDHRAVELLRAGAGLPPLEEHHAVGPPGHGLVAPEPHLARGLRHVHGAPVDPAGGLLHQDPGPAPAERTHQVGGHRRSHRRDGVRRVLVDVVADDVLPLGPLPIVHGLEEAHEVGRDRGSRAVAGEHLALQLVALQEGVGAEAVEVELLAGVGPAGRPAGREDLLPVGVALRPDVGAPGTVQLFERPVAPAQPLAEVGGRHLAVAGRHVAPVLVAGVPHGDRGMAAVALGHRRHQPAGGVPVEGAAGAVLLTGPRPEPDAVGQDGQHLGVTV